MHGERFFREFSRIMGLDDHGGRARELAAFLESRGYLHGERSAENVILIGSFFSLDSLYHIVAGSLLTPVPDLALNAFERLAGVIPTEDLAEVAQRRKRLEQFILLCGSSSFLVNLIYKVPAAFRWLFLENAIDLARREGEMLTALRSHVDYTTDFTELLRVLRCFKRVEILRIAARDLNGLASLEEVTEELSSLAAASLQVAYEVCRRCLVRECGLPLMESEDGPREAEMTVIGMGKLGGNELNFSSDIDIIYFYESGRGETSGIENGPGGRKWCCLAACFFQQTGRDDQQGPLPGYGGWFCLPGGRGAAAGGQIRRYGCFSAFGGDLLRIVGPVLGAYGHAQGEARSRFPGTGQQVAEDAPAVRLP